MPPCEMAECFCMSVSERREKEKKGEKEREKERVERGREISSRLPLQHTDGKAQSMPSTGPLAAPAHHSYSRRAASVSLSKDPTEYGFDVGER